MRSLMLRRTAMMGATKPSSWLSSTGRRYTEDMTIEVRGLISSTLAQWGMMEHLKSLTLTGRYGMLATGSNGQNGKSIWSNTPKLDTLIMSPSSSATSSGAIVFDHYMFSGTNLKRLVLGTPHLVPFLSGAYFRTDMPVPPGTSSTNTGSAAGMELIVYVNGYKANGGFMSALAPNTTVHEYDYMTGEEIFS